MSGGISPLRNKNMPGPNPQHFPIGYYVNVVIVEVVVVELGNKQLPKSQHMLTILTT